MTRERAYQLRKKAQGLCVQCGRRKIEGNANHCLLCYAKQLRRNTRYQRRYPERVRAGNAVNRAIASGQLTRQCCALCGTSKQVDAHHHNGYANPLDVQWLCRSCHLTTHGRTKTASIEGATAALFVEKP